jgi:O-antigen/teichoic acid export membrane protein
MLVMVASLGVALFIGIAYLRRCRSGPIVKFGSPAGGQSYMRQSLPFLGLALFSIVGTETNTLLLGWLVGPREAGLYQPIAKLSPILLLAKDAVEMPLAPRIAQLWDRGARDELQRVLRHSAIASTVATIAITAAILAISPYVFAAFGSEFVEYQPYLYWIAGAQIANAFFGASPLLLMMSNDMRRRLLAQLVTLVVQAGLGVALVPAFGVAGGVFALFAAILTWSIVHWLVAWRTTGMDAAAFPLIPALNGRPK